MIKEGETLYRFADEDSSAVADSLGGASPGFSGIPIRDEIRLKRPTCVAGA